MVNKIYMSLDISTTNVGIAIFNSTGELLELRHLKLKNDPDIIDFDRLLYKSINFKEYFKELFDVLVSKKLSIADIYIEEPLLASIDQGTAIKLQKFNGMCSYIVYDIFNLYPKLISVHESRKLFCPELVTKSVKRGKIIEKMSFPKDYIKNKKQYIWEKVSSKEANIDWFYTRTGSLKQESYDMSDAYCVGKSSLYKYGIIKNV